MLRPSARCAAGRRLLANVPPRTCSRRFPSRSQRGSHAPQYVLAPSPVGVRGPATASRSGDHRNREPVSSPVPPSQVPRAWLAPATVPAHPPRPRRHHTCNPPSPHSTSAFTPTHVGTERPHARRTHTTTASPAWRCPNRSASCGRSVLAPLAVSVHTRSHPAALSASSCSAAVWSAVLTLEYPKSALITTDCSRTRRQLDW